MPRSRRTARKLGGRDPGSPPAAGQRPAGPGSAGRRGDQLARALGWASAGLGVPLLAVPHWVAEGIGIGDSPRVRATLAGVGAQELSAATGLLGWESPLWLWGRAGSDVLHLSLLGPTLRRRDAGWPRRLGATVFVAGCLGLDLYAAASRTRRQPVMDLTAATTVARSPQEIYEIWRDLERLPTFMTHLEEVSAAGDGMTHWRASAPFGRTVQWDAQTVEDRPGERIAWRSTGGDIGNEGTVEFRPAPGGRGTEVHVRLRYAVPAGPVGAAVARYFGQEPHQQLDDDLRRFKQVAETGEVVRSDGAPGGKRARREFPQHPAQPLTDQELEKLTS
jgi:uncharacterized membrane protein